MRRLFWVLLVVATASVLTGVLMGILSRTDDPGTRFAPTQAGWGIYFTVGGVTLAICVLLLAAWWQGTARLRTRVQGERPGDHVMIVQSTKSLRALVSRSQQPQPLSTYAVCAVGATGLGVWAHGRMVISVPPSSIDHVSVGTVFTSRPVPALVFSGAVGEFELVPGRVGWELFPMLDREQVGSLAESLIGRLKQRKAAPRS